MKKTETRDGRIIRYSLAGIAMNLLLAGFKLAAGYLAHSHAVILDGVNSLTDSVSSVISLVAASLSGRRRDGSHPLGYGRIEYLGAMTVTLIVISIGVEMIVGSVRTILHPHDPPEYDLAVFLVMVISLVCKLFYGILMRRRGRELGSVAMIMSGTDSFGDALMSGAILAAIGVYALCGIDVEHYLCLIIALMMIRTGVEMLHRCVNDILGTRIDPEIRKNMIHTAAGMPGVLGISNLVLHNYGRERYVGSMDVEVEESTSAAEIARLSRRIIRAAEKLGITLTSVGVSAANTSDPETVQLWDDIIRLAARHPGIRRIHSFSYDEAEKVISFYLVPDQSRRDRDGDIAAFLEELSAEFPDLTPDIYTGIDM